MSDFPMPDSPPVRADVPIDLHPDALGGHAKVLDVETTIGRYALADGRTALTLAYTAIASLNDAEKAVREATGEAPEAFFDAADKAVRRATSQLDARVASLSNHIKALETRVAEALASPSAVAAEIRSHVKALPANKRTTFAHEAIQRDDKTTVAALLAAPSFLSGLDDKELGLVRTRAAAKFAPVDASQLTATREVLDKVHAAGSRLIARYGKVVDLRDSPAVRAAQSVRKLAEGK